MRYIWVLLLLAVYCNLRAEQRPVRAWVELTGEGPSIRAIVDGGICPEIMVDGRPLAMTVRAVPGEAFPLATCQAQVPTGARYAVVGGERLRLTVKKLKRIVVVGDTGCRLKGEQIQDCNDPRKWPFSLTAQRAAAKKPDLVIHVGDYYYRESKCPPGREGCSGSPHGDSWESWRADFFDPASGLLAAAPWVFARGNHEQCGRGAEGWFRFLDAGEAPLSCPATAPGFLVKLPGLELNVIDSADVNDRQLSADRIAFYVSQLPKDAGASPGTKAAEIWLLTHKPLWGYELTAAGEKVVAANPLLAAAASAMDEPSAAQLPGLDMLLAGHVHFFATLDFSGAWHSLRPAQLIVGDSGTALDAADARSGEQVIDGLMAKYTVKDTFGYFVLDRKKNGWAGRLYSVDDTVLATCSHQARQIECRTGAE